ncbi:carboxymuconolactone decarboxylase family protein [Vreelandella populi]|uniref:carboxymuconolactone decarboxylase family protein n=1 Tax=Vreelandella populi TaxID=2498858 RepID=UPI000F8CF31B|nr:carboxymuconolactone decarboxylase family protein [Halomonas populi]RUR55823.1 carboxymuconolactone decarboxylase family protein [Halomonas populi]
MSQRIAQQAVYKMMPRLAKHLVPLGEVMPNSAVTPTIIHLVKLRVSQINQCCFCQHMHTQEARNDGEHQVRLDVLPAWREAPCFSEQERAALEWAEALTLISQQTISDSAYQNALAAFGEQDLLELITVILAINSWNRVAVSMQFVPDISL